MAKIERFQAVEPLALALLASVGAGAAFGEAPARASLRPSPQVDALLRNLQALDVLDVLA